MHPEHLVRKRSHEGSVLTKSWKRLFFARLQALAGIRLHGTQVGGKLWSQMPGDLYPGDLGLSRQMLFP
jgi:hypothetical protein